MCLSKSIFALLCAMLLVECITVVTVFAASAAEDIPQSRDILRWPFSAESIWNMPIGSNAVFSGELVPADRVQPPNGYGVDNEIVIMAPASPLRQVTTHSWPARCYQAGDFVTTMSWPVPDGFLVRLGDKDWSGNTPNHAGGVLLPDGSTIQEFNYFSRCTPTGPVSITPDGLRGTLDLRGDGRGNGRENWGGHGGSMLSGVGGSIRVGELTGPEPIRHVTKVTIDATRWCMWYDMRNHYRWPAYTADSGRNVRYGTNAKGYSPILGMGSLLAIPGNVNIENLGLETAPAKKLAWTWQNYGMYVVDNNGLNNGWGQNAVNVEYGVVSEMRNVGIDIQTWAPNGYEDNAWNRDMNRLFAQLREVVNNSATSIGGGGTPRQPLAPPFVK